jgi:hypothetical protein
MVCNLTAWVCSNIDFSQWWGGAYGNSTASAAYAFTTSSHAIGRQAFIMEGQLDSYHPPYTIHGVPSFDPPTPNLPSAKEHPLFYVGIYSALGIGSALVGVLSAIVQYTGALRASKVLFMRLLVTVVRATMRWHDTTPQGKLISFHLNAAFTNA